MEEKIKNIVSLYTKIAVDNITGQTVIDRTAVTSSIILHRMYGNLRNEGVAVENYWDIKTYGDLLQQVNGGNKIASLPVTIIEAEGYDNLQDEAISIGTDIEEIKNMPSVNDFREDEFYVMNFTPAEISYAILQPDPLATFAGLFAAKEAIVKSDNTIKNKAFNSIFIDHLPSGKPIYPGFSISISHTPTLAMASAVKLISPKTSTQVISQETPSGNNNYLVYLLFFLTGILSAGLIFLLFFKK